jgi:hypothetical protein|tara:strand:- start:297 stop:458 length:162 start_codon:yes stop_codon:yes gene_type:complete
MVGTKKKFAVTFSFSGTRRIATPRGKGIGLTMKQAEAIKKRLKGKNPRILKLK